MNTILTLQVTPTAAITSTPSDCIFNGRGGSIGRNVSNTWVLPDSTKHLSGKHAVIDYSNGNYQLTDTSTNGVFVNNSTYALGRGNSVLLKAGDTLRMGPYQIKIILAEEASTAVATEDPYDPFADIGVPVTESEPKSRSPVEQSDVPNMLDMPDMSNATSMPSPFPSEQESNVNKLDKLDNVDLEENWWSTPPSNNATANPMGNSFDNFFDGIGDNNGTFIDGDEQEAAIIEENNNQAIPDDFPNIDKAPVKAPLKDPFLEQEKVLETGALSAETKIVRPKPALRSIKKTSEVLDEPNKSLSEVSESSDPLASPLAQHVSRSQRSQEQAKTPVKPKPIVNTPAKSTESTNNTDRDVMASFLKGAGIHDPEVQTKIAKQLDPEALGRMFQTSIKGTIDVLRSRTDIKSEMRMDMTVIQPIQNNPLKFSISLEDTLIRLMTAQKEAYMTPERAMTEAYDDIKAHQMAVMAGIQVTLHTLLKRFQPDNLIQRLEKESPIAASIPFHRQAKLWKHFEYLYETIEQEAEEDFNRLFGAEFAKAYEQQIENIKGKR
ncbi:MAG TPA: type VI secretion system-associated FHA domain protein TagH [Thiothrix sp.]|nr:type VI secretion system-associated FHA domain protein TagH [Thiothrix sp.]